MTRTSQSPMSFHLILGRGLRFLQLLFSPSQLSSSFQPHVLWETCTLSVPSDLSVLTFKPAAFAHDIGVSAVSVSGAVKGKPCLAVRRGPGGDPWKHLMIPKEGWHGSQAYY